MSLVSQVAQELSRILRKDVDAARDIPVEVKSLLGVVEKEFLRLEARIAALESRHVGAQGTTLTPKGLPEPSPQSFIAPRPV